MDVSKMIAAAKQKRGKAKAAAAAPAPAPTGVRRGIGFKPTATGARGHGTITRLDHDGDENGNSASVEIRHGEHPRKPDGSRDYSKPSAPTTRLTLPKAMAHGLSLGQRVRVHVEPVK